MRTMATRWQDLIVWNDGQEVGTLAEMIASRDRGLTQIDAIGEDGSIAGWQQYFITTEGEEPDWDTPRGEVDWTGFAVALQATGIAIV